MITPVLLAGGHGTRLWPLSREQHPKQLLPLLGNKSLLQQTIDRISRLPGLSRPIVVCLEAHHQLIETQLKTINSEALILVQTANRETAPAIATAACQALHQNQDQPALLLVLPVDHLIDEIDIMAAALAAGQAPAKSGWLVSFGISPTRPETGYGYIKPDKVAIDSGTVFKVESFVEKPDVLKAISYLEQGYLWNSGIYLFDSERFLSELERFEPRIVKQSKLAFEQREEGEGFIRLQREAFAVCPARSVDYALMEKTDRAVVVPLACGWCDIGSWDTLSALQESDSAGNTTHGEVVLKDSRNCYAHSTSRLLTLLGVEDLVVIETADAVLVTKREKTQDVKVLVNELRSQHKDEL